MKRFFTFIFISIVAFTACAQFKRSDDNLDFTIASAEKAMISPMFLRAPAPFDGKKLRGERMRNVGKALTLGGIAGIIIGIDLVANNLATTNNTTYVNGSYVTNTTENSTAEIGALLFTYGLGSTVTGIVLWTKGNHKMRRALLDERGLSFKMKGTGGTLKFRF